MSDTDEFKPADRLAELQRMEEQQRAGFGRIEYDEQGNPVWVPRTSLSSAEVMQKLLDDDSLSIADEQNRGTVRRIQPNPKGLKKGYDPYDSGLLVKKQWKKKKDLRALSKWIEQKKKLERDP